MGLRFREKYLLLIGIVSLGLFLISGLLFYYSSNEFSWNSNQNSPRQEFWNRRKAIVHNRENKRRKAERANDEMLSFQRVQQVEIFKPSLSASDSQRQDNEYRREFVKKMMKFAWNSYVKYAWGYNELRPITKTWHSGSVFGRAKLGATIVDAIDTLFIMGFEEEFAQATQWIEQSLDLLEASNDLSVFETNIRFVGGLLSSYALTNNSLFLSKARYIADLLFPAFDATSSGVPLALVNLDTGTASNYGWASGGCSILAEFGSLELEFAFLSKLTGNKTYVEKCRRAREFLAGLDKPDGLYPNYLNPRIGKWCQNHVSIGALGDSFYEYLLKVWLFGGKTDSSLWKMYKNAIRALEKKLLFKSERSKLWYFAELKGTHIEHKMDHLACFAAGLFALHSLHEDDEGQRAHYVELAEHIGETCHQSYISSATKLGPESFHFASDVEARSVRLQESYYILRPEAVEGWFYLWRVTGKQRYRDWCWEAVEALERNCATAAGYSGIRNVNVVPPDQDDVQQSFFLAETLKYLYLTFSDDTQLSLNEWVFNTEGHPFPINLRRSSA